MILTETKLNGVYLIEPKRFEDGRGFFAPCFSAAEFKERGLVNNFVGHNISFSKHRGTLRGMHYQAAPYGQGKLVRCTRGAIFDVGVDLRPDSPTFRQWIGVELTNENRLLLYIPGDFAHGYLSLEENTEVAYHVTGAYVPESSRGFRWNDPSFGIQWPDVGELVMNERDRTYPEFTQ